MVIGIVRSNGFVIVKCEVKEVYEVKEVKDERKYPADWAVETLLFFSLLPIPPELPLLPFSEWRVAAAGGKRPATARGLLLAADGCADKIFDRIGGCIVPLFGQRAAACPAGERRGCVGDGFLRVAHQDRRGGVGKIGIRFRVAQTNLRVLRRAEEVDAVGAPFPDAERNVLHAGRQTAVLR